MSLLLKPLKLSNVVLNHNILAAPLAGYTDCASRQLSLEWGAAIAFSEMISCEGLWRLSAKTQPIMNRADDEANLALQLFAGNQEALEKSLPIALAQNPQLIDFNCGCPVAKVIKSGSGSALMQNPALFSRLMRILRDNVPSSIAVSVKIRSGWHSQQINYLTIAQLALEAGVTMLTMHPRTRAQGYSGKADWGQLALLRQTFPQALLCGSGDLTSPEAVKAMLEQTGVDAVMLARGAIGNPFIFKQTTNFLTTSSYTQPTPYQKITTALQHLKLVLYYKQSCNLIGEFKKHLLAYIKGFTGSAELRGELAICSTSDQIERLLTNKLSSILEGR